MSIVSVFSSGDRFDFCGLSLINFKKSSCSLVVASLSVGHTPVLFAGSSAISYCSGSATCSGSEAKKESSNVLCRTYSSSGSSVSCSLCS